MPSVFRRRMIVSLIAVVVLTGTFVTYVLPPTSTSHEPPQRTLLFGVRSGTER